MTPVAEQLVAADLKHRHWQIASERAGFALRMLTAASGVAVALLIGVMAFNARHADGLVIKPFSVPPELAARGQTGEALASQLLDHLSTMSGTGRTSEVQRRISADWGDNISIEIPQTGVSLSQVDQWLRARLGRQVRVTGELMQQADGSLKLVTRLGSDALPVQAAGSGQVDELVVLAAEALYQHEQPVSYWQYLSQVGRRADALGVAHEMIQRGDRATRARGWNLYGTGIQSIQGDAAAAAAHRRSFDIEPSGYAAHSLSDIVGAAGHPEAAYRLRREALRLMTRDDKQSATGRRAGELSLQLLLASDAGDVQAELAAALAFGETEAEGLRIPLRARRDRIAIARAKGHESAAARTELADHYLVHGVPPHPSTTIQVALALEDWAAAASTCDPLISLIERLPDKGVMQRSLRSGCTVAYARTGRLPEAEALVGSTPLDCQPCVLARAAIAELKAQPALADHWFAQASRMTPSLPHADFNWAKVLFARRDYDRAQTRLAEALRRAPRYADALAFSGEVLLARGRARDAARRFSEAAVLAPRWGRLHLKWGEALVKSGDEEGARLRLGKAAGLDLTPGERQQLDAILRGLGDEKTGRSRLTRMALGIALRS